MIEVLIVEDHPMVIEGLKTILETNHNVKLAGIATNGVEALKLCKEMKPHVVLLDIRLPDCKGTDLCKDIIKLSPESGVIALTTHSQELYIRNMIDNGAKGYLLKSSPPEEIMKAIETVFSGKKYFSTEVSDLLRTSESKPLYISKREKEVLQLIAKGLTNHEIADKLFLSPLTVDSHRKNLIAKLGVKNTAEMISYAISTGIIE
jgi:DNA-binding NarL/FixJ family response regulator